MHNITNMTVDCHREGTLEKELSYLAYIYGIIMVLCCFGGCYIIPKYKVTPSESVLP